MTTARTTQAAERLAALLDLAREHDDDVNYAEVELLLAAAHPRLALQETRRRDRLAPPVTTSCFQPLTPPRSTAP